MRQAFNYLRPDGGYIHVTPELYTRYHEPRATRVRAYGETIPYTDPEGLEERTVVRCDSPGMSYYATVPWFGYRAIEVHLIPLRAREQVLTALKALSDAGDEDATTILNALRFDCRRTGDRPDLVEPEPCTKPYDEWTWDAPNYRLTHTNHEEDEWVPVRTPTDFINTGATTAGTTFTTTANNTWTNATTMPEPATGRWTTTGMATHGDMVLPGNFTIRAYDENGVETTPAQGVTTFNQTRGITAGNPNARARVVIDDFEPPPLIRTNTIPQFTNNALRDIPIDATTEQFDGLIENARAWMQQTGVDYTDAILPTTRVTPGPNTILVNGQTYADIITNRIIENNP